MAAKKHFPLLGTSLFFIIGLVLLTSYFFNANPPVFSNPAQTLFRQNSPEPTPPPLPNPTLLFLGDLMYDRDIRTHTRRHGARWPLEPLEPLMQSHDAVVATLEGPITANPSVSAGSAVGSPRNFIFTFPLDTAPALAQQGNFILNIGNNHIQNQGVSGVESTKRVLKENNLAFFGWTGQEKTSEERVSFITLQGDTFAFVNYNQFLPDGLELALQDTAWTQAQSSVAATVVVPHWGNEYQPTANHTIRTWATQLIDAGGDLIVGSHPHVVQDFDEIHGVPVYFSLGNTVFDQYFSPETMTGLAVSATWQRDTKTWSFEEFPLEISRTGQTRVR